MDLFDAETWLPQITASVSLPPVCSFSSACAPTLSIEYQLHGTSLPVTIRTIGNVFLCALSAAEIIDPQTGESRFAAGASAHFREKALRFCRNNADRFTTLYPGVPYVISHFFRDEYSEPYSGPHDLSTRVSMNEPYQSEEQLTQGADPEDSTQVFWTKHQRLRPSGMNQLRIGKEYIIKPRDTIYISSWRHGTKDELLDALESGLSLPSDSTGFIRIRGLNVVSFKVEA